MKKLMLAFLFTVLAWPVLAATCPQTSLQVKDNAGNTANMTVVDDGTGSGNCVAKYNTQLLTSGGMTPKILNALTNSAVSIKASAGQLFVLQCGNTNATEEYVQVYNTASGSVSVGSTSPVLSIPIAGSATGGFALPFVGLQFSTAISVAATTTATGGSAPSTALDCNAAFN